MIAAMTMTKIMGNEKKVIFPVAANRLWDESTMAMEREVVIKIRFSEKHFRETISSYVSEKVGKSISEALHFCQVSSVDELSNYKKRALEYTKKKLEERIRNVEEVLCSLDFVSPREVIYRGVHYTRYEEVKNLTLNHIEALEERMRDFEYDSTLVQAHENYEENVKAFLKLVKFS